MLGEALARLEIEAVGAMAVLFEKRSLYPASLASGHAPFSSASILDASAVLASIFLNIRKFQLLANNPDIGIRFFCKKL